MTAAADITAHADPAARARRDEVQALRGIAVAMVLAFHLWPEAVPGGFAGVDVFFVISGYLITAQLLRERTATGRVALRRFWARRIARLLPAALLVLAATLAMALAWLPATRWQAVAVEVAASALWLENAWLAHLAADYFGAAQAASPVQHYWSLSVEEQFYLAWPLLLAAAALSARRAATATMLAAVAVASFAWSLHATAVSPATAFFSTFARGWEFAAGGLLALVHLHAPAPAADARWPSIAGWAGAAGLVAACWLLDPETPFPGIAALLPVAATVAVIAGGTPARHGSPAPLWRARPLQWLGDIAYPAYLWHWPLVVVAPFALGAAPGHAARAGLLAATLLLAWATSRTLEHRFRRAAQAPAVGRVYVVAAFAVLAVCAAAFALHRAGTPLAAADAAPAAGDCVGADALRPGRDCPRRFRVPDTAELLTVTSAGGALWLYERAERDPAFRASCRFVAERTQACALPGFERPALRIVLAGDSHLVQYLPVLALLARENRWNLTYHLSMGCPPALPTPAFAGEAALTAACRDWRARLPAALAARDDADLVVSAASTRRFGRDHDAATLAPLADGFARTWQRWRDGGRAVLVLVDNPVFVGDDGRAAVPSDCLARAGDVDGACALPRARALPRDPVDIALDAGVPGVHAFDPTWAFCDATTCRFAVGGMTTHFDDNHVTARYLLTLMPELGAAILRAAGRDPAQLRLPDTTDAARPSPVAAPAPAGQPLPPSRSSQPASTARASSTPCLVSPENACTPTLSP